MNKKPVRVAVTGAAELASSTTSTRSVAVSSPHSTRCLPAQAVTAKGSMREAKTRMAEK